MSWMVPNGACDGGRVTGGVSVMIVVVVRLRNSFPRSCEILQLCKDAYTKASVS